MTPSPLRPILSVTALLGVCLGMLCVSESVGKVALILRGPQAGETPILSQPAPLIVANSGAVDFTPTVIAGSNLEYSIAALPGWSVESFDTSTGQLTGTAETGAYNLTITATDTVSSESDSVVLNVQVYSSSVTIDQTWLDNNDGGTAPWYLDTANTRYLLDVDAAADGTAFAVIASNVTFDLNDHTVTYDNATPISISNASFETEDAANGATEAEGWDFTNAATADRFNGDFLSNEVYDGDYSLRFPAATVTEYVESEGTVTLEANTTYSLSAMFRYASGGNPGVEFYVQLVGTGGETTRELSYTGIFSRGIQLREFEFTTGGSAENYNVRVGIVGHASATLAAYIDDIKIQRTKVYGVANNPVGYDAATYPGIDTYGTAADTVVTNGTFTQGTDGATWAHAVFYRGTSGVYHDLNITVNGANTAGVASKFGSATTISSNTITSNVLTITSRDQFNGAMMSSVQGVITGNTLTGGPHAGIVMLADVQSEVSYNTIAQKSRYTNAFAIVGNNGKGPHIHHNTINNGTGIYSGRGIGSGAGTESTPTLIHDNTVAVQQLNDNQEYGGTPIGGAYGIQIEGASWIEIYDNDVTVYGTTLGYALRITGNSDNTTIRDNTFEAIANGTGGHAACISLNGSPTGAFEDPYDDASGVTFTGNTLETNEGLLGSMAHNRGVVFRNTTITVANAIATPYIFDVEYSAFADVHTSITFLDTVFTDAGSRTYFENATTEASPKYVRGTNARMEVLLAWSTTLTIQGDSTPLASTAVAIQDQADNEVFSGTTNGSGVISPDIEEFRINGTTKTDYNPHAVIVSGYNEGALTVDEANETSTINLTSP